MMLWCGGCVSWGADLDPESRWRRAVRQQTTAVEALDDLRLLRNDYEAVILLDHSGRYRGRALLGLAELDLAQLHYVPARANLERALRAGLESPDRIAALLLLADILERRLNLSTEAESVYRQILQEHPRSREAELARLRLEGLTR